MNNRAHREVMEEQFEANIHIGRPMLRRNADRGGEGERCK